jgi:hypothetical protein
LAAPAPRRLWNHKKLTRRLGHCIGGLSHRRIAAFAVFAELGKPAFVGQLQAVKFAANAIKYLRSIDQHLGPKIIEILQHIEDRGIARQYYKPTNNRAHLW